MTSIFAILLVLLQIYFCNGVPGMETIMDPVINSMGSSVIHKVVSEVGSKVSSAIGGGHNNHREHHHKSSGHGHSGGRRHHANNNKLNIDNDPANILGDASKKNELGIDNNMKLNNNNNNINFIKGAIFGAILICIISCLSVLIICGCIYYCRKFGLFTKQKKYRYISVEQTDSENESENELE